MEEINYVDDLQRGHGVPSKFDSNEAYSLLPCLKMFYDATMRKSGSYYVTIYMCVCVCVCAREKEREREKGICNW